MTQHGDHTMHMHVGKWQSAAFHSNVIPGGGGGHCKKGKFQVGACGLEVSTHYAAVLILVQVLPTCGIRLQQCARVPKPASALAPHHRVMYIQFLLHCRLCVNTALSQHWIPV